MKYDRAVLGKMSCLGTHTDTRDYEMEMDFSFHSQSPNTEM